MAAGQGGTSQSETVQNLGVVKRLSETDGGRIALRRRDRDRMCR